MQQINVICWLLSYQLPEHAIFFSVSCRSHKSLSYEWFASILRQYWMVFCLQICHNAIFFHLLSKALESRIMVVFKAETKKTSTFVLVEFISSHMAPMYIETPYVSSHIVSMYIDTPCIYYIPSILYIFLLNFLYIYHLYT